MSRLNELSEREISLLAEAACNVRFMSRELRDAINHVLELAKAEDEDEDEPGFEVGDKVLVFNENDDYHVDYVGEIASLDKDTAKIKVGKGFVTVSLDRIEPCLGPCSLDDEEPTAETQERSSFMNQVSYYDAMRMEIAKEVALACIESDWSYSADMVISNAIYVANGVVNGIRKSSDRR